MDILRSFRPEAILVQMGAALLWRIQLPRNLVKVLNQLVLCTTRTRDRFQIATRRVERVAGGTGVK